MTCRQKKIEEEKEQEEDKKKMMAEMKAIRQRNKRLRKEKVEEMKGDYIRNEKGKGDESGGDKGGQSGENKGCEKGKQIEQGPSDEEKVEEGEIADEIGIKDYMEEDLTNEELILLSSSVAHVVRHMNELEQLLGVEPCQLDDCLGFPQNFKRKFPKRIMNQV